MVASHQTGGLWPQLYSPLRNFGTRLAEWLSPASDASSDEDAYRISVELPGVGEDDVTLSVEAGVLSISGEKTATREETGETWYVSERQYGAFRRSFQLPADADADAAAARMANGVLEITVPRRKPSEPKGRKIKVARG